MKNFYLINKLFLSALLLVNGFLFAQDVVVEGNQTPPAPQPGTIKPMGNDSDSGQITSPIDMYEIYLLAAAVLLLFYFAWRLQQGRKNAATH